MTLPSSLWLEQSEGRRRAIEARDFPIIIGGPSADIDLADNGDRAAAFIGTEADDMFVQPGDAGIPVTCNGAPLTASHWLRDGDVVRVAATRISMAVAVMRNKIAARAMLPSRPSSQRSRRTGGRVAEALRIG